MLEENVFRIIGQVMNIPYGDVSEDTSPDNLEVWDSFQHMNLVLALEEEFKIRFTDEEIVQLSGAGMILQSLQNKGVGA